MGRFGSCTDRTNLHRMVTVLGGWGTEWEREEGPVKVMDVCPELWNVVSFACCCCLIIYVPRKSGRTEIEPALFVHAGCAPEDVRPPVIVFFVFFSTTRAVCVCVCVCVCVSVWGGISLQGLSSD